MICEICSKLTRKSLKGRHWRRFGVTTMNFEQISHIGLVFSWLPLNKQITTGNETTKYSLCFIQIGVKFTEVWHIMWFFAGTLIWYYIHTNIRTHTNKNIQHTQGAVDWHTHINIYLHQLLCAHSSCLYCTEWIINWYQKFPFHNVFTFQKLFSCKSHISVD